MHHTHVYKIGGSIPTIIQAISLSWSKIYGWTLFKVLKLSANIECAKSIIFAKCQITFYFGLLHT